MAIGARPATKAVSGLKVFFFQYFFENFLKIKFFTLIVGPIVLVDFFKFGLIRPNNGRVVAIYRLKLVDIKVNQNRDSNQYSGVCIVLHTDLPPLCLNCECVCEC